MVYYFYFKIKRVYMQIEYDELTRSSVHKIREIARNIGVKSPTLLTKQKLIEQILKISNREIEPSFNKRKVGRPPKSLNLNTTDNYATFEIENKKDGTFTLNYPSSYFASTKENEQTEELKGYLYINENYGFFSAGNKLRVVVSLALIKHHKLKIGDKITVLANPDPANEKIYIAINIIKVDNFKLGEDRLHFDNLKIVKSSKKIENNSQKLSGLHLKTGEKYFIETPDASFVHDIAGEVINNFKNTDFNVLYLNFDGNRNKNLYENIETKILFNEKEKEKILKVDVFFEHVKRNVEQGKNCVVVFSSFWKYMRDLNLFYNKNTSHIVLLQTITKVRDIIALARNTENGASITMFIIDNFDMPEIYMEVIKYDVLANIDNKIKIDF